MKGQTQEILEIFLLVAASTIVITISLYVISLNKSNTEKIFVDVYQSDRVNTALIDYYYKKVPPSKRNTMQMLGDAVLFREKTVNYGFGDVSVNVSKLTYEYFDTNFGVGKWHLTVKPAGFEWGYEIPKDGRVRANTIIIPIPSNDGKFKTGKLFTW